MSASIPCMALAGRSAQRPMYTSLNLTGFENDTTLGRQEIKYIKKNANEVMGWEMKDIRNRNDMVLKKEEFRYVTDGNEQWKNLMTTSLDSEWIKCIGNGIENKWFTCYWTFHIFFIARHQEETQIHFYCAFHVFLMNLLMIKLPWFVWSPLYIRAIIKTTFLL